MKPSRFVLWIICCLEAGERSLDYSRLRRFGEDNFKLKIGGTIYEISTHFNPKGRQCVMEQFKELILSEKLI